MIHYYPCPGEDNVQAMIDADYQMAQQMQAEEQEKLSIEEKYQIRICRDGSEVRAEAGDRQAELQRLIEVVPDKEEVAIDAIPLATKPPSIVDWKIHKKGEKLLPD
ncbi:hypothetical protein Tco_0287334 [Tanacetum coccineum]